MLCLCLAVVLHAAQSYVTYMRLIAYWEETVPRTTATHNRTATKPRPLISILTLTGEPKIFKREKVKETMMKIQVLFQYEST